MSRGLTIGITGALMLPLLVTALFTSDSRANRPVLTLEELMKPGGLSLTFALSSEDPASLISEVDRFGTFEGRLIYERDWLVTARGSVAAGPDLDASRCAACHIETHPNGSGDALPWIAKPVAEHHRDRYGDQLTTRHVRGEAEARFDVQYERSEFSYSDGRTLTLRRPLSFAETRNGERIQVALRTAPLLFGWGLIESADRDMISALEDEHDENNDGISGRQPDKNGQPAFLGWKNSQASLRDQIAAALANDMGVLDSSRAGEHSEISDSELDSLTRFVALLGVPERRNTRSRRGQDLFGMAGCSNCHTSVMLTTESDEPALSNQLIWPYTNLLLHDMGPGLADPGDSALASEWRTAPLWGVGYVEEHLPQRGFLHDGRARSIEEAIVWHGGEAAPAREYFADLPKADRDALLEFVRSL